MYPINCKEFEEKLKKVFLDDKTQNPHAKLTKKQKEDYLKNGDFSEAIKNYYNTACLFYDRHGRTDIFTDEGVLYFLVFLINHANNYNSPKTFNEEDYPMTYKEYEKRVIELTIEEAQPRFTREDALERIKGVLKDDPSMLYIVYGQSCSWYKEAIEKNEDNPEQWFEDSGLSYLPVNVLLKTL